MHPRLITAKRLFVKTVTKTLWSSGLKQSSHYQRWWGSSGLSFNLLFFIFLPTAFLTETTFVTVVYSSYLIHREALRIKPYNTVTLLWVHKNIKKSKKQKRSIQTALRKHLLAQQPQKSTHTADIQTCSRSYQVVPELQSVALHAHKLFKIFSEVVSPSRWQLRSVLVVGWLSFFFFSSPSCFRWTETIRAKLTINLKMAVFGSIRSTWNGVNTTCFYMRVYKRQGVSVPGGWFSCHWSSFVFPHLKKSLELLPLTQSPNLCKPAAGEGQHYILYVSVLNNRGLINILYHSKHSPHPWFSV